MDFAKMFMEMGVVGWAVMACLMLLSLYSVALIVDKARRFRTARRQSDAFVAEFERHLEAGKLQDAIMTAHQYPDAPVARVVNAGVWEYQSSAAADADESMRIELVERATDRTADRTLSEMKKGMGNLATIGSMSPFIGLFGTIVGIIHAFQGIAESGSGGVAAVSGGIAEALVATALGILVAIPAVMGFNHFTVALERFRIDMRANAERMVDTMKKSASVSSRRPQTNPRLAAHGR